MGNNSSKDKSRNFSNINELNEELKFLGYKGKKFEKFLKKKLTLDFDYSNPTSVFKWEEHYSEEIHSIHYAGAKASEEGLQFLLNSGIDVNLRTSSGLTCLHFAVVFGNLKIIDALVYAHAEINAKEYVHGYTSLHFACKMKEINIVKKLLQHNAKFTIIDKRHNLPLDIAEKVGSKPIVELLNNHSLQASKRDYEERSFIIEALGDSSGYDTFTTEHSDHNFHSAGRVHQFNAGHRSSYKLHDRNSQFTYPEADFIRENYEFLLCHMLHVRDITNKLFARGHVTLRFKEELRNKNDHDQNEELLVFIMKANKEKFIAFVASLQETGQGELANLLISNEQDAAAVMFYQQQNVSIYNEYQQATRQRMSAVLNNQDGYLLHNGQVLMFPDAYNNSEQAYFNPNHTYVNFPQPQQQQQQQSQQQHNLQSHSRQNSAVFSREHQQIQRTGSSFQDYNNYNPDEETVFVSPECQNYIPESYVTDFIPDDGDKNWIHPRQSMISSADNVNHSQNGASIMNVFANRDVLVNQQSLQSLYEQHQHLV